MAMATVADVGAFISAQAGPITDLRLQKLVYYAQAWSLAWDGAPLFPERIEAWPEGPACGELRRQGVGAGQPEALSKEERATILAVLDFYGQLTDQQLVELTHREGPWRDARRGRRRWSRSTHAISTGALARYYGPAANQAPGKRIPDSVRRGIWLLLDTPEDEVDTLGAIDPVDGEAALTWFETGENNPWADHE